MEAHEDYIGRTPRRGPSLFTVVLLAIAFGLVAGFGGALAALTAAQQGKLAFLTRGSIDASSGQQAGNLPILSGGKSGGGSFVQVADRMDESVVNINTISQQTNPFPYFFGGGSQEVKGLGTGVIVDADGYILTNNHVVDGANDIMVTVMHKGGKRQYKAKFIGGDKQEDLALIKIDAKGLRPAVFGDSDALRPGEPVMAIGNPYGFEHTVSVGVVSALNRKLDVDDTVTLRNMIQTDASINPGNSGGPLVNSNGEVVGINSAVFVGQSGNGPQARGIGFSIPSNHARKTMEYFRKGKSVPHPFIGVSYRDIADISPEERNRMYLPMKTGVLIVATLQDGPAAKAGIKPGDVIVAIDGKTLQEKSDMDNYIKSREVGQTVTMSVRSWDDAAGAWTDKSVKVKIGNMPTDFSQRMNPQQQQRNTPAPEERRGPSPWGF